MEFVTFELAKKLKEKGFREECFARYHCSDKAYSSAEINSYHPNIESIFYCYNNDKDLSRFYIDAPTIDEVLRWLRKEKKIHVMISASYDEVYWWDVRYFNRIISDYCDTEFDSYEEAVLSGIKHVLDNLI